jgi:hypothetical protein
MLPRPTRQKRDETFANFHTRVDDFVWMVDWKAAGKPFCHIYIIGPREQRPVKVGVSSDCWRRLGGIQGGNWHDLFVLRSFWVESTRDARKIEQTTHVELREQHLSGEWFEVTTEQAVAALERVASRLGIELRSGIPDELRELVAAGIRQRAAPNGDEEHELRADLVSKYGVSRSIVDQLAAIENR